MKEVLDFLKESGVFSQQWKEISPVSVPSVP